MPPFDREIAAERLEAGVAEIGVLDARQGATRKESDGGAADAGGAGKSVRSAAEVVDQSVIPVAHEFADHADARAADVDPVIEALRNGRRGVGVIVVTAAVEMHAAGDGNAILIVRGADGRPVVRHFHDRIRWRNRTLDRNGRVGVGDSDLGVGLGIGFCGGSGIGGGLLLQLVELLLHQAQLLFQQRQSPGHCSAVDCAWACEANISPIRLTAVATPDFVFDMRIPLYPWI